MFKFLGKMFQSGPVSAQPTVAPSLEPLIFTGQASELMEHRRTQEAEVRRDEKAESVFRSLGKLSQEFSESWNNGLSEMERAAERRTLWRDVERHLENAKGLDDFDFGSRCLDYWERDGRLATDQLTRTHDVRAQACTVIAMGVEYFRDEFNRNLAA